MSPLSQSGMVAPFAFEAKRRAGKGSLEGAGTGPWDGRRHSAGEPIRWCPRQDGIRKTLPAWWVSRSRFPDDTARDAGTVIDVLDSDLQNRCTGFNTGG